VSSGDPRTGDAKGVIPEADSPLTRSTRGWLDHLRVERGAANNTLSSYRRDLARYGQFLTERGISDPVAVGESDITEFLASLREGAPERPPLSASSAARTLIAVRGFHRFLTQEGTTPTDPAEGVAPPKVPKRLPKSISITDVESLMSAASLGDGPAALRDRAILEVLYGAAHESANASAWTLMTSTSLTTTPMTATPGRGPCVCSARGTRNASFRSGAMHVRQSRLTPFERAHPWCCGAKDPSTVSEPARRATLTPGCMGCDPLGSRTCWPGGHCQPAHSEALLRHTHARWRGRRARGSGTARSRLRDHDPDLHYGDRPAPARGLCRGPSPGAMNTICSRQAARCLESGPSARLGSTRSARLTDELSTTLGGNTCD